MAALVFDGRLGCGKPKTIFLLTAAFLHSKIPRRWQGIFEYIKLKKVKLSPPHHAATAAVVLPVLNAVHQFLFELAIEFKEALRALIAEDAVEAILVFLFNVELGLLLLQFGQPFVYPHQFVAELGMHGPEFLRFIGRKHQLFGDEGHVQGFYFFLALSAAFGQVALRGYGKGRG